MTALRWLPTSAMQGHGPSDRDGGRAGQSLSPWSLPEGAACTPVPLSEGRGKQLNTPPPPPHWAQFFSG